MQILLPTKQHNGLNWAIIIVLVLSIFVSVATHKLLFLLTAPVFILFLVILHKPDILYYLLILSIPFSAEWQVTHSLGTDFPDEILMWAISTLVLVAMIVKPASVKPEIWKHPLSLLLAFHFSWIIATLIFSSDPVLSLKYAAAKAWYILSFVIGSILFVDNERKLRLVFGLLLISVLCTSLIILGRHSLYNFSFDVVSQVTLPFYRNHVNYAALLVCTIPIAIGAYFLNSKHKTWWILLVSILIVALALSYSRGAWLALVMGAVTAIAVKYKFVVRMYASLFIATLAIVVYLGNSNRYLNYRPDFNKTIYHEDFRQHMQATYQFRDLSTAERFYRWIAAIRMMKGHWLTGYGPNNFYPNYKGYAVTDFRTYVSGNKEKSTVHNYFLLLLTEQGIPGLIFFLVLFFAMLFYAQRIYHNTSSRFCRMASLVIAAILGAICVLISLSDLIETDKVGSVFFMCLGLIVIMHTNVGRRKRGELLRRYLHPILPMIVSISI